MHEKNTKIRDTSGMSNEEISAYLSQFEITRIGRWEFYFDAMDKPELYLHEYHGVKESLQWNEYFLIEGRVDQKRQTETQGNLQDDRTALAVFQQRYPNIEEEDREYLRHLEEERRQALAERQNGLWSSFRTSFSNINSSNL